MNTSGYQNPYIVADAAPVERATFIRRTYFHLAGAILAFVLLEAALLRSPLATFMLERLSGGYSWLMVLGGFMLVSWVANKWATSNTSRPVQYLGLGLYVVAEAIIFLPMLYIAAFYSDPNVIPMAGMITLGLFFGLTAVVVITRKDFSFLRSALMVGGFVAIGVIIASVVFGFNLGLLFSGIMVIFAGAAILYTTSNILREYQTDQYVAASLALFAAVALLFWYVLRIVMSFGRD